ncbi:glycosyltransferase family 2 protein [Pseudomonas phenolilytica]|uniref:glycosyltransferase family 2 protein n=1 Tax=Pseudomonas phenolilytica TaxID=2746321 RepID=UPI001F34A479|nr:glycosyltransferase family 2 protein [Pseudomonas phenolilytica]UIP87271.1 glycosyltransferase [Pseudomonas phenolilytica]
MKISVITVAYNSSATIGTTLDSVQAQGYLDLEYIVVDGGSTDATLDVVRNYPGLVTQLISEPDRGIYDAMNKGVQRATGEVVGILNSDDFYRHSRVLQEVAEAFAADPELEVLMGDVDFVSDEDLQRPVRTYRATDFRPWMFRLGFMPPHPAIFIRKTAYESVGLYKLGYKIAADFDLLVRLLLINRAKYQVTGACWVRMRTGGASTAGWKSNLVSTREMLRSLRENGIFSCLPMLLIRLPVKYIKQVFL